MSFPAAVVEHFGAQYFAKSVVTTFRLGHYVADGLLNNTHEAVFASDDLDPETKARILSFEHIRLDDAAYSARMTKIAHIIEYLKIVNPEFMGVAA